MNGEKKERKHFSFQDKGVSTERQVYKDVCKPQQVFIFLPFTLNSLGKNGKTMKKRRPRVTTFHHTYCLCMTKAGHISVRTSRSMLHAH